jgi:photosystem II stability/assembly factor-like uncharacterized protein
MPRRLREAAPQVPARRMTGVRSHTRIALARGAPPGYDRAMVRRIALACIALAAAARLASANGRPPGTSSISFRPGDDRDIAVGLTFGLLISHDAGKTWAWMCENAVGYGGTYDPDYAFSTSGALFASTFDGLKVTRDSCTFGGTPSGTAFVATQLFGPDNALYVAASQVADPAHGIAADFNIYRSADDGMTFPTIGQPPGPVSWWQSLAIAPSDSQRLYLTGYRYVKDPSGPGTLKEHLMFRSDNGGTGWSALPITDFVVMPNSRINIVGIVKSDPDHLYARVELDDNQVSDSIYRSTDGGARWTRINHKAGPIPAFLVRDNGDLIAGTQVLGAEISRDDGDTWTPLVNPPHMNCLVESSAGEIWACTQNFGRPTVPSDDAGIMKTTDLVNWTKVLRYQDLTDAVACAAGTIQADTCAAMWCATCAQLGCTPSPSYGCPPVEPDDPVDPVDGPPSSKGGCCDSGSGSGGALALGLAVGTLALRPRRRRFAGPTQLARRES